MRRSQMLQYVIVALLIVLGTGLAIASGASSFPKRQWHVAKVFCPIGCPHDVISFLNQYRGKAVEISPSRFKAPFTDTCDGEVHIDITETSASEVVKELNEGVKPSRRRFSTNNLKISSGPMRSAVVYCKDAGVDLPMARLVSIAEDRILVLFEEQSIIELR